MSRYLFGPVKEKFAHSHLSKFIAAGDCVAFDFEGPLALQDCDSWEAFCKKFPAGWLPDFLVLRLQYCSIPVWLLQSPMPIIGLAADWNLQWHHYRSLVPFCDHILTDGPGEERFRREGVCHVSAACLFGGDPAWAVDPGCKPERDIDVLFIGNTHPFVQAERLPWLFRISQLSDKFNIYISDGVFDDDYQRLLARSRIVFNRSIRGECNMRVFETLATGGLLFQEAANTEVPRLLAHGQECIYYDEHNLEELISHYLLHESERMAIADRSRSRIHEFTYEQSWESQLSLISALAGQAAERMQTRISIRKVLSFQARTWQRQTAAFGSDGSLTEDLRQVATPAVSDSKLHYLLGCNLSIERKSHDAEHHFRLAFEFDPRNVVAGVALAETLASVNRRADATAVAKRVLRMLSADTQLENYVIDLPLAQPGFTLLRVAWEKAAFENAGNPANEVAAKRALLRWCLLMVLGETTGNVAFFLRSPRFATGHQTDACLHRANTPTEWNARAGGLPSSDRG